MPCNRPTLADLLSPEPTDIEALSAILHSIYQSEAKRQGDIRHHDDYSMLSENIKEFDRVLARYVLARDASNVRLTLQLAAAAMCEHCKAGQLELRCNAVGEYYHEDAEAVGFRFDTCYADALHKILAANKETSHD